MKTRGKNILSFNDVQNLDDDINILVNRSFLYTTYAKYNAKKKYELLETILPYITTDNKEISTYDSEWKLLARYVKMPSKDAKKIFSDIKEKDLWPQTFRMTPENHHQKILKN